MDDTSKIGDISNLGEPLSPIDKPDSPTQPGRDSNLSMKDKGSITKGTLKLKALKNPPQGKKSAPARLLEPINSKKISEKLVPIPMEKEKGKLSVLLKKKLE